jgi:hypothetical protein
MPLLPPLALGAAYVLAAIQGCPAAAPPALAFHAVIAEPIILNDRSSQELAASVPADSPHVRDFPVHNGLTESNFSSGFTSLFRSVEAAPEKFCLTLQKVEATVTYRAEVHIAKEHRPDSCRYVTTKAHELRHVDTDRAVLGELLPGIEQRLAAELARIGAEGPMAEGRLAAAKQKIADHLAALLKAELENILAVQSLRQRAIDTPAEYTRLTRACPGRR